MGKLIAFTNGSRGFGFFQPVSEEVWGKPVKSIPESVVDHWLFYKDPKLTGPPQSFVFIVQEGAFSDHP